MSNINENIKKDLIKLYEDLYCLSQCEAAANFFNKNTLKKLKYNPEEIKEALESTSIVSEKTNQKIKPEIIEIENKEQVFLYFKDNLLVICQPDITEEEKNNILRKTTLEEIKYLYQIVFDIPLADKCKKIDAIYKIKDFFDNEQRTADLTKNFS